MRDTKIYGIKNCDTMKKALKYLDSLNIEYSFHDYKKLGVDINVLKDAIDAHGWESVINKRGTTWRKLSDDIKNKMDNNLSINIAVENPSIIKRPLLCHNDNSILGFQIETYKALFEQNKPV